MTQGYRIYTTDFDVETTGEALTRQLMPRERVLWDQQIALFQEQTALLRTEAGLSALPQVDATLGDPDFDPAQTAVSVLVDHSGSLRGQGAIITCLVTQLIADFLGRCGVTYEVLGFTTRDWRGGGRSRQKWLLSGRPERPGRLSDLLHIVYRDAGASAPGAGHAIHHLLREGLLKENIDGEAVLWASARLERLGRARKLMLVVSDGTPVDDSTLSVNGPGYLESHLRVVLADLAARLGTRGVGIGVDSDLSGLYPDMLRIDRMDKLPERLPVFLAMALRELAQA